MKESATEQLLQSDAVDRAVAGIDFRPLHDQKVYFDTRYIQNYKGIGFVNSEYIISALRQQMVAAGLLLQESQANAEYIVECRIGTLGTDSHEVIYGLPATSALSNASSALPQLPTLPSLPELALARKSDALAAAKVGAFAYHRESGRRVWQSGLSIARSTAQDAWVMGVGPFERGTIHDGIQFAGGINAPLFGQETGEPLNPHVRYGEAAIFETPQIPVEEPAPEIQQASAEEPAE